MFLSQIFNTEKRDGGQGDRWFSIQAEALIKDQHDKL